MSKFKITGWKSCAMWPNVISLGNEKNISEDTHSTERQAEGVCRGLRQEGFGGDGKIFPIAAWYEPVIVKEPERIKIAKWSHVPQDGLMKPALLAFDESGKQVAFAVEYLSGWCIVNIEQLSRGRFSTPKDVHVAVEEYFANQQI